MENSTMYTYIPETHFQTSDQSGMEASTYIPETSYETGDHVIKIENAPRLKKRLCQPSEQRLLDNSEQRICSAIEELREISASARSMEREDEFDIFGRSVAAQLRQLPLTDALSIQLKLQTILTEARIRASQNQSRQENGMTECF
ncbi:hypothetical protein L9F63_003814 [Diploptera punctata]|uniref:BESS domain-containing protein n=2 Tax=Diploptera punctata TaxID=6984 RepID=A0AAD8E9H9_DIPPU|nr:hypothetical protein L9F63_003814 [Diploptera punctata]